MLRTEAAQSSVALICKFRANRRSPVAEDRAGKTPTSAASAIGTKFADERRDGLPGLGAKRRSVQANSFLDTHCSSNVQDLAAHSQSHIGFPCRACEWGRSVNSGPVACNRIGKVSARAGLDIDCGRV